MRKNKILVGVIVLIIWANTYANNVCGGYFGILTCGNGEVDNINFLGDVHMEGTRVLDKTRILGMLDANYSHFKFLNLRGEISLRKTEVDADAVLTGYVKATEVHFYASLDLRGNLSARDFYVKGWAKIFGSIDCQNCHFNQNSTFVGDVQFKDSQLMAPALIDAHVINFVRTNANDIKIKYPNDGREQVINLIDASTVHDIKFENGKGIIYVSKNSVITGSVSGGQVISN
jgi:cytoskeletal protein CcmA (bactofilin family)